MNLDFQTKYAPPLTREANRWNTLQWIWFLDKHEGAKRVRSTGAEKAGWFPTWQREVHSRLFTGDRVKELDHIPIDASGAAKLHSLLDELPEWGNLIKRATKDAYASGAVATSLSNKLLDCIPQHSHDAEDLRQLVELLEEDDRLGELRRPEDLAEAREKLSQATQEASELAGGMNDSALRQAMREAISEASGQLDDLDKASRALGWGAGPGGGGAGGSAEMKSQVAERLLRSDKLRQLMEIAGRMKNIMNEVQATKVRHGVSEITDIETGDDISRLLPSELSKLRDPRRKLLLWRELLEHSAMEYKLDAKEKVGRGPIVVAIDDSGSMSGSREIWAKSVALALLELARKENRDFAYCSFSDDVHYTLTEIGEKKLSPIDLADAMLFHKGGGTDFDNPLYWCLKQIETGGLPDADIIFISDGACRLANVDRMREKIAKAGCKVIGVGIGGRSAITDSLGEFCTETFGLDEISLIEKGNEEKAVLKTVLGL